MSAEPLILGISSGYHNGSACLLRGNRVLVAIQEERLSRVKRDPMPPGSPALAIDYCLAAAGAQPTDLDAVVECSVMFRGSPGRRARGWPVVQAGASRLEVYAIPHHVGHAYGAFCTSGFGEALVLVIDGAGSLGWQLDPVERAACVRFGTAMCEHLSIYHGHDGRLTPLEKQMSEMPYLRKLRAGGMPPFASLGHIFASVSMQLFDDFLAAGKVMALASFAEPTIPVDHFVTAGEKGFDFPCEVVKRFRDDARWPRRHEEYADLSASAQRALEEALRTVRDRLRSLAPSSPLCYAGGVALNGVANRRVLLDDQRGEVHIMPASDDAGPAIGAAYYGLAQLTGSAHAPRLRTDSLGRRYRKAEVDRAIAALPAARLSDNGEEAREQAAELLAARRTIGWFQGGAEFGPRALGARNILCDPRLHDGQRLLNMIKRREPFRPFAPAVLAESAAEWFDVPASSRPMEFMLDVCPVRPERRSEIPAVVHVDGTARAHAVDPDHNAAFHDLIRRFRDRTDVPMVVSTSMNVAGEPIVETPRDALWLLLTTELDALVLGNALVTKPENFESILDLRPVRTGRVVSRPRRAVLGPARRRVRVAAANPHGPVEHELEAAHADWLLACDGRASARELLEHRGALEEQELATLISRFFRYSLIDFDLGRNGVNEERFGALV